MATSRRFVIFDLELQLWRIFATILTPQKCQKDTLLKGYISCLEEKLKNRFNGVIFIHMSNLPSPWSVIDIV